MESNIIYLDKIKNPDLNHYEKPFPNFDKLADQKLKTVLI